MGTRFVLVSLALLIIQFINLDKFFVISCLRNKKKKNLLPSHDTEKKAFVTSAKGSGLYEKIVPFSFHSVLNSVFLNSSSASIFSLPGSILVYMSARQP